MTDLTISAEESTLHFPRILCLHGGGTNARIFRIQCHVLQRSLSRSFRLVYAEGLFPAQPGSDVISVYEDYGPFKSWQQLASSGGPEGNAQGTIDLIEQAIFNAMHADDRRGATGEFVAILGFSQGAKIAASILHMQQMRHKRPGWTPYGRWPEFRFAVLLAGRGPLVCLAPDMAVPRDLVDATKPATTTMKDVVIPIEGANENMLHIPTIHVHGLQDPGLELHREMLRCYCSPSSVTLIEWEGDHRLPIQSKHVNPIVEQIQSLALQTGALRQ